MLKYYTAKDIADMVGETARNIQLTAVNESWPYREAKAIGGTRREYEISDLPSKYADAIQDFEVKELVKQAYPKASLEELAREKSFHLEPDDFKNPDVLRKLECYKRIEAAPAYANGKYCMNRSMTVAALADKYKVGRATIWRWRKDVESWKANPRKKLSNVKVNGSSMSLALPKTRMSEAAQKFAISVIAENPQVTKKSVFKKMQEMSGPSGWTLPDYTNFTRWLNKIQPEYWTYVMKGAAGFELECVPKWRRSWIDVPVYTFLCGDQKVSDYSIYDPDTDTVYPLNFYLWMDCSSRYWAGVWPSFGPYNKFTYGAALREVCRIALPQILYTDHGKPEKSDYAMRVEFNVQSMGMSIKDWEDYKAECGHLDKGAMRKLAHAGKPWHKPVENHMNIVEISLKDMFLAGYRHRSDDAWLNKKLTATQKAQRKAGMLLTKAEFLEIVMVIIEKHNTSLMDITEREEPIIPAQVLAQGLSEGTYIRIAEDTLDIMFMPIQKRKIRQAEIRVKVGKGDLRFYQLPAWGKAELNGHWCQVAYDPFDPDRESYILNEKGEYICKAERTGFVAPGNDEAVTKVLKANKKYHKMWKSAFSQMIDKDLGKSVVRTGLASGAANIAAKAAKADQAPADVLSIGDLKKAKGILNQKYDEIFGNKNAAEY